MLNWSLLLKWALFDGLALSLALTAILILIGSIAPDMFVNSYPPDIREKYGPRSPRSSRIRPIAAVLIFIVAFAIPLTGLALLRTRMDPIGFGPAFVFSAAAILVFNTYDLLVLDWLIFCTIQPRVMVLPGTQGMAGYRDYRFHFTGFLKGLGFCLVGGVLVAGIWWIAILIIGQASDGVI